MAGRDCRVPHHARDEKSHGIGRAESQGSTRLFHITDEGLRAVVHVFIAAHERAARAKANCDRSPDQSNIAVLPSPKNAVSGVQPWTIPQ
jgi:hypothetical protein